MKRLPIIFVFVVLGLALKFFLVLLLSFLTDGLCQSNVKLVAKDNGRKQTMMSFPSWQAKEGGKKEKAPWVGLHFPCSTLGVAVARNMYNIVRLSLHFFFLCAAHCIKRALFA